MQMHDISSTSVTMDVGRYVRAVVVFSCPYFTPITGLIIVYYYHHYSS